MAFKKSDIDALKDATPEQKKDLFDLFGQIESTDAEIVKLKRENADANKVVQKYPEMEKLLADKEKQSSDLQAKLDALTTKSTVPVVAEREGNSGPFGVIFDSVDEMFGSGKASD